MEAGSRLAAVPVILALFLLVGSVQGGVDEIALAESFDDAYDAASPEGAKAHPASTHKPANGAPKDILPITGWTDSLDGVMDTKALCKHLHTELDVARSRFQSNTRRRLEKHYGAARVTEMSEAYHHKLSELRKEKELNGCPPTQVVGSTLLWHDDMEQKRTQHCASLKRQQRKIVHTYQASVKAMMLRKMPVVFTASVNRLYTVTRSLRARLAEQRCPGSSFGAIIQHPQSQSQPQPQPQPQPQHPNGAAAPVSQTPHEASVLRAAIAAASQRITKHTRVVQGMQGSMSDMSKQMAMISDRMKALRARMSLASAQVKGMDNEIMREVVYARHQASQLSKLQNAH